MEDLTILCERCHGYFHEFEGLGANIPPLYRKASFDNFGLPGPENPIARRELTNALLALKSYVRDFPNHARPGLLLIGEPGTGKTHLAVAALRALIEKGMQGLFFDYQDLMEKVGTGYKDATAAAINLEVCRNVELLLLDDLGSHRPKDAHRRCHHERS